LRQLIIIFIIFILTNCGNKSGSSKDTVPPFTVILYSGDEEVRKSEIRIYEESGKFYAENVSPYFYYGTQTDSVWKVELDQNKISTCNKFLNKAKSLPKRCPERSTSIEDYTIIVQKDTIKINGNCEWDNLDLFSLRKSLFNEKFTELDLKKTNLINGLNSKLIGKWYFKPLKLEPKRDDSLVLTKTNNLNSECSWEFGKDNYFKSSCNKIFDFTYSDTYGWRVDGNIFFEIQTGLITNKNGITSVGNSNALFTLDKLTDKELRLKFLWR